MPTTGQDLTTVTDEDLSDILLHINREKFPERYAAVRNEYARRYGATHDGRPIDEYLAAARQRRPFTERRVARLRILKVLLGWGALMLLLRGILYVVATLRSP